MGGVRLECDPGKPPCSFPDDDQEIELREASDNSAARALESEVSDNDSSASEANASDALDESGAEEQGMHEGQGDDGQDEALGGHAGGADDGGGGVGEHAVEAPDPVLDRPAYNPPQPTTDCLVSAMFVRKWGKSRGCEDVGLDNKAGIWV
jgi:hypothetical protein